MTSAEDIETRLARIEERLERLEHGDSTDSPSTTHHTKKMSIKEYLIDKNPRTANDRALTMGFFLESISGHELFTAEDIKECFRMAKIPPPKNINDVINQNIAKGYVMESGKANVGAKSWVLTASGEAAVNRGFNSDK